MARSPADSSADSQLESRERAVDICTGPLPRSGMETFKASTEIPTFT